MIALHEIVATVARRWTRCRNAPPLGSGGYLIRLAAAGYGARVRVWKLDEGVAREINSITGHNGWVHCVAFHPTEANIYSADSWGGQTSREQTLSRLWQEDGGKKMRREKHLRALSSCELVSRHREAVPE